MDKQLPRLAWFTATQSQDSESVAAYFSSQVLPELIARFEIRVFSAEVGELAGADFAVGDYLAAFSEHKANPFDVFVYNVEDRVSSDFARMHLGLMPGVVLFHDAVLWRAGAVSYYNSYWEKIVAKAKDYSSKWPDYSKRKELSPPFGEREIGLALLPLCTSAHQVPRLFQLCESGQELLSDLKCDTHQVKPARLPSYIPLPANLSDKGREFSSKEGNKDSLKKIAYCGAPEAKNRVSKLLSAISKLESKVSFEWLVAESEVGNANKLVVDFDLSNITTIRTGRCPKSWSELVSKADIACHLHFSQYGGMGQYLPISLATGTPSVLSDVACSKFVPDNAVVKVLPSEREAKELYQVFYSLCFGENAEALSKILSQRAYVFASQMHCPKVVASEFSAALTNALPRIQVQLGLWERLMFKARGEISAEAKAIFESNPQSSLEWESDINPVFKELAWL